ncbi:MAG: hypothetical protein N3D11_02370 [Candidatus Sumerlaeia bacterium]|nr:hypothetical protein [Candidatus Sumerlaeia bacterium]
MRRTFNRRRFLAASAAAASGMTLPGRTAQPEPAVAVCNPLLRTPLGLIIDDSCPIINLGYYWIKQRHDWRVRLHPETKPSGWEVHYDKLDRMPQTVPAEFAARWGEWCGEQGIRGKFSMVPFPAGIGRIDKDFPNFPERELKEWIRVTRDIIWPNFDLTPEMLTHTHVVDLKTWKLTDQWEQGEWVDPPVDLLTDYIIAAMQLLKNAGLRADGVTSPGAFGKRKEPAYSKAILDAAMQVNGDTRPSYFLWLKTDEMPDVPIYHAQKDKGIAIASIVSCAGDWFGATGWDTANADLFITEDLQGGKLPTVLAKELPCVMTGHWPCFYANNQIGFGVLKTVKQRLDRYDPDRAKTIWMKNSEIGRYWMARELSDIASEAGRVRIRTQFPTPNFTLSLGVAARRVQVNGADLKEVQSRRNFRSGTFLVEGKTTYAAFDLAAGETAIGVA